MKQPTEEQLAILEAVRKGNPEIAIQAYAGTGKTSTLELISKQTTGNVLYVVYNKAAQEEAKNRLRGATCTTLHGLAYHYSRDLVEGRDLTKKLTPAQWVNATGREFGSSDEDYLLAERLRNTIQLFCQSSAKKIAWSHVEGYFYREEKRKEIADLANKAWELLTSLSAPVGLPLPHDIYLKRFFLQEYQLPYDLGLFDEDQDLTPATWAFIASQQFQRVTAGDAYQRINSYRGALPPHPSSRPEVTTLPLTQSWRYGEEIAELAAQVIYNGLDEFIGLKGNPAIKSEFIPRKCKVRLARNNITLLKEALSLFRKRTPFYFHSSIRAPREHLLRFHKLKTNARNKKAIEGVSNWDDALRRAANQPRSTFAEWVNLIDQTPYEELVNALKFAQRARDNNSITLSTVHAAKGLSLIHI